MSVATGRGDDGTTRLAGGRKVSKADPRVEAYGTIDELGSRLGLARAHCGADPLNGRIEELQRELFVVGAELASPPADRERLKTRLTADHIARLEAEIAGIEALPGILDDWALPGATPVGSHLDLARAVCRRAERRTVALFDAGEEDNKLLLVYLNRLGDLLWLYARWYELRAGAEGALRPPRQDQAGGPPGRFSDPT